MSFNKIAAVLIAFMFSVMPSGSVRAEDGTYVFILKSRGNPYWQAVVDGINETASSIGLRATIYQLASDTAAEEQLNTCMTALVQHPKFLALSAVTPSVGLACMKEAAKYHIAVADMDENLLPADAEKAGLKLAFSVGSDNYQIGRKAAEYLKKTLSNPHPKILILEGGVGSVPGDKRVNGFKDGLREFLPSAQIIASISADWDRLKAMNITSDVLQREPSLDVVYGANDLMALGAVEAKRISAKAHPILVIGVDGTADARKAIMAGNMTATVAQLPYLIGKRAVEKAVAIEKNQSTEPLEMTPTPILDSDFLSAKTDPLLKYVR